MYIVKVEARESKIDGKGVFGLEKVHKGQTVWVYDAKHDLALTQDEFAKLEDETKKHFHHSAYLSPWTGLWICPPIDDASNYTNHSAQNNLTIRYDKNISSEPYFVANRDIEIGEEITNNYHEFDELTRQENPEWARVK